jgi:hypothetical protein
METSSQVRHGANPYIVMCIVLSLLGWIPLVTSQPMMHGGTLFDTVLAIAGVTVGGYGTIELIRYASNRWAKVLWGLWLLPYLLVVVLWLHLAIPYVPRLFAI